jgi:hypothetical protein
MGRMAESTSILGLALELVVPRMLIYSWHNRLLVEGVPDWRDARADRDGGEQIRCHWIAERVESFLIQSQRNRIACSRVQMAVRRKKTLAIFDRRLSIPGEQRQVSPTTGRNPLAEW